MLVRAKALHQCVAQLQPVFFFFSSRGRHTRWPRDWSSDVCSSDLSSYRKACCADFAVCWPGSVGGTGFGPSGESLQSGGTPGPRSRLASENCSPSPSDSATTRPLRRCRLTGSDGSSEFPAPHSRNTCGARRERSWEPSSARRADASAQCDAGWPSLFPRFFRLRAELGAPAFPAAGRAHRVPGVALHANHLVQPAVFGLGETGHRGGEARAVYNGFGRRGRCFMETDLITIRFGRLGSKGGLARFNAWTIRAWTAGMSSVSGLYSTICRADFPFPFRRRFGSARFVPWRKKKMIHLVNTAIENTATEVRSVVPNPTARAL